MEKEFIPYEQAQVLKELGFDEPCLIKIQYSSGSDIYTNQKFENSIWFGNGFDAEIDDKKIQYNFPKYSEQKWGNLNIPLYQQAFDWFRKEYGFIHCICPMLVMKKDINRIWEIYIGKSGEELSIWNEDFKGTYEEARLECLNILIKIYNEK